MAWPLAKEIAQSILDGFDRHYLLFREITAGARRRFEAAQWAAVQASSKERIYYYDRRVNETIEHLRSRYEIIELDEMLWKRIKVEYVRLLHQHRQPELAETFYNSVFCRLFHRRYYHNRNIFVRPAVATDHIETDVPAYRCLYPARDGFSKVIGDILTSFGFSLPFADIRKDICNIMRFIRDGFPGAEAREQNFHLAVLNFAFFRNKAAYIIGRAVNGPTKTPFAIPILNDEHGGLYVDTLLVGESDFANVFSFTRAYFMVDAEAPSTVVNFLSRLLPFKTKADLYTAIGLQKHGKTEFYRDFLEHLRHSGDAFVVAPGVKGMVMAVFTLPSYPYVFKVIKDTFGPTKDMSRDTVKKKYQLVKQHDRVGRMADSLEYSDAAFPLDRFSPELLDELRREAGSSVELANSQVIVKHLYIERRMTPLNIYIQTASDQLLRHAIAEYGQAIRELAAANIFPGDMLFKNFGVTRHERVVFYDYDEICYMTETNFRRIPPAPYPEYEMMAEPWYSVGPNDVFPEEFATFLLAERRVRHIFVELHGDLLDAEYWQRKQYHIQAGHFEDVFPYPEARRFPRRIVPHFGSRQARPVVAASA